VEPYFQLNDGNKYRAALNSQYMSICTTMMTRPGCHAIGATGCYSYIVCIIFMQSTSYTDMEDHEV